MTTTGVGHPDWQAYANWRGQLASDVGVNYPPGSTAVGPFVTTNYASVFFSFNQSGGTVGQIELSWFDDVAMDNQVEALVFNLNTNTQIQVLLPAMGSALGIEVNNFGVGDIVADLYVLPTNLTPTRQMHHVLFPAMGNPAGNVAAGATSTTITQFMYGGPAFLFFDPQSTAGKLDFTMSSLDEDGNVDQQFIHFSLPTAPVHLMIAVPAAPIQVKVHNTDGAAAHTYAWSLVPANN